MVKSPVNLSEQDLPSSGSPTKVTKRGNVDRIVNHPKWSKFFMIVILGTAAILIKKIAPIVEVYEAHATGGLHYTERQSRALEAIAAELKQLRQNACPR